MQKSDEKTLVLLVNDIKVIEYYTPIVNFTYKVASKSIILKNGYNKLSLTSEGLSDPYGFRVFDVQIRSTNIF